MLADRIRDYLLICVTASSRTHNATEFTSGHISISNSEDDASSVVRAEEAGYLQESPPRGWCYYRRFVYTVAMASAR